MPLGPGGPAPRPRQKHKNPGEWAPPGLNEAYSYYCFKLDIPAFTFLVTDLHFKDALVIPTP